MTPLLLHELFYQTLIRAREGVRSRFIPDFFFFWLLRVLLSELTDTLQTRIQLIHGSVYPKKGMCSKSGCTTTTHHLFQR